MAVALGRCLSPLNSGCLCLLHASRADLYGRNLHDGGPSFHTVLCTSSEDGLHVYGVWRETAEVFPAKEAHTKLDGEKVQAQSTASRVRGSRLALALFNDQLQTLSASAAFPRGVLVPSATMLSPINIAMRPRLSCIAGLMRMDRCAANVVLKCTEEDFSIGARSSGRRNTAGINHASPSTPEISRPRGFYQIGRETANLSNLPRWIQPGRSSPRPLYDLIMAVGSTFASIYRPFSDEPPGPR